MPWALLKLRTEVTSPVFSALLSVSIDFIFVKIEFVEFLRDFFPVMDFAIVLESLVVSVFHNTAEEVGLVVAP